MEICAKWHKVKGFGGNTSKEVSLEIPELEVFGNLLPFLAQLALETDIESNDGKATP